MVKKGLCQGVGRFGCYPSLSFEFQASSIKHQASSLKHLHGLWLRRDYARVWEGSGLPSAGCYPSLSFEFQASGIKHQALYIPVFYEDGKKKQSESPKGLASHIFSLCLY
ncbi:hypothetical protein QUF72_11730 [Desulfobacterales bacterium HSG2]|nr:hypothetical protein [Desulfobacterales bacterium HSG2]